MGHVVINMSTFVTVKYTERQSTFQVYVFQDNVNSSSEFDSKLR